jgi:hypothetical protein
MVVGGGLVLSLRLAHLFVVSSVCCVFGRGDFLVFFLCSLYISVFIKIRKKKKVSSGKDHVVLYCFLHYCLFLRGI